MSYHLKYAALPLLTISARPFNNDHSTNEDLVVSVGITRGAQVERKSEATPKCGPRGGPKWSQGVPGGPKI